jgi:hypothetical protein
VYPTCAFAYSAQPVVSRRFAVVRGTGAGRMRDGAESRNGTLWCASVRECTRRL